MLGTDCELLSVLIRFYFSCDVYTYLKNILFCIMFVNPQGISLLCHVTFDAPGNGRGGAGLCPTSTKDAQRPR